MKNSVKESATTTTVEANNAPVIAQTNEVTVIPTETETVESPKYGKFTAEQVVEMHREACVKVAHYQTIYEQRYNADYKLPCTIKQLTVALFTHFQSVEITSVLRARATKSSINTSRVKQDLGLQAAWTGESNGTTTPRKAKGYSVAMPTLDAVLYGSLFAAGKVEDANLLMADFQNALNVWNTEKAKFEKEQKANNKADYLLKSYTIGEKIAKMQVELAKLVADLNEISEVQYDEKFFIKHKEIIAEIRGEVETVETVESEEEKAF